MEKIMKIVVVIPARYGSTRFSGKPLAKIAGKPMIQWVYEKTKQASNITDVYVATDDRRIFDSVKGFGGNVVITSKENRSGTDRVAEAAEIIGLEMNDIVVNVQGDQPLLDPRCLDQLVAPFFADPELEISTLVFKITHKEEIINPKDVKVAFDQQGYALYFSRSAIPYGRDDAMDFDTYKHLGFYAYTRKFLEIFRNLPEGTLEKIEKLEQLRAIEYGHSIKVVITKYDSPEVDLPEDIARIEMLVKKNSR
jgi:3-deoxy-manno-octulosonate cytidylyltransferase (CMP-KDO synthetase)